MRYLLDTCVISDFIKGEAGTKVRLKQTPPIDIAVWAITVMELRYGLALNPQRAQKVESAISSFWLLSQFSLSAPQKQNKRLKFGLSLNLKVGQ